MKEEKIAIFFDCENINAKYVDEIFNELANIGEVIIRQAIKDWSSNQHKSWNNDILEKFAIEPIQIFNSPGKNTSDLRIVRGIMEILSNPNITTIVLVSSDSDFRDLAMTIKSKGISVIGFGEEKTPNRLRDVYTTFFELPIDKKSINKNKNLLIKILKDAIENTKDEDDCALVSRIGSYLKNKNSSYNAKNFGASRWGDIIKDNLDTFEISYKDNKRSTMLVKTK